MARVAVLVVFALVVATAVWLGTRHGDDADTTGASASHRASDVQAATSTARSKRLAPRDAEDAPADGVQLPTGSTQTDGYPTGFPYTDLGAVAVQAELARAQIGFDYHQAATVARIYADPADLKVFENRSADAVRLRRRQAGVPVHGGVPAPASYAATPLAYTLQQLDSDYYVVNLLSYLTLTTADSTSRDGYYAGTQLVRWIPDTHTNPDPDADIDSDADADADADAGASSAGGGDWKVVQGSSSDIQRIVDQGQPQAVAPDTAEFERAGWIRIDTTITVDDTSDPTGALG